MAITNDAQTSTAWIAFAKETRTSTSSKPAAEPLGGVSVTLHSDLVPWGVQNFVSFLPRATGARVRLEGTSMSLSLEDGNPRTPLNETYYVGSEDDDCNFPRDRRGLLSWARGEGDPDRWEFRITVGEGGEAVDPGVSHLVFGYINLFDSSSSQTFDLIERALIDGHTVRISDSQLVACQFKDLLDCAYGTEINWDSVRALMALARSHPRYEAKARWVVGNKNRKRVKERNILQAVLYHNAPADILSEAIDMASLSDVISPDKGTRFDMTPLSMAFERTVDMSIICQIFVKMDESDDASSLYADVFKRVCITRFEEESLLMLVVRIGCEHKAIFEVLEEIVYGFRRVERDDGSHTIIWADSKYMRPRCIVETVEGLSQIWDKICCLLHAIKFCEMRRRQRPFSPLGTLFQLGQMKPGFATLDYGETCLYHRSPDLTFDGGLSSMMFLVEYVATVSPSTLYTLDSRGMTPLHHAASAFYDDEERQSDYPYDDEVGPDRFDGNSIQPGFDLRGGEKILSYLLERGGLQYALTKDGDGNTVLDLLLKDKFRRPIVRIHLVLEAFPELCQVNDRGVLPFYTAMRLPDEIEHDGRVTEQLYVNSCFITAHNKIGVAFDSINDDVLRRFKESLDTARRSLEDHEHNAISTTMRQAASLLLLLKGTESFRSSMLFQMLQLGAEMIPDFDVYPEYLDQARFEESIKSLVAASDCDISDEHLSQWTQLAFAMTDKDDKDGATLEVTVRVRDDRLRQKWKDDEDAHGVSMLHRHVLVEALRARSKGCNGVSDAIVLSFLENAIPYYKAMATSRIAGIEEVRCEESPPRWSSRTTEERLAKRCEELQSVVAEAESNLNLFLEGRSFALDSRKPLLHAALEFGSDVDGIAKRILLLDPSASSRVHDGTCPLHVAIRGGCNMQMVQDLLSLFPDSLTLRESALSLCPFQLAACSEKASLDHVFALLRRQPSLVDKLE